MIKKVLWALELTLFGYSICIETVARAVFMKSKYLIYPSLIPHAWKFLFKS